MDKAEINKLLKELGRIYSELKGPKLEIGICGGAALILTGLVHRATRDIDLLYPVNLPTEFNEAIKIVAQNYGLSENWINQGPVDLFTMGLPTDYQSRSVQMFLANNLTAYLAGRKDQIFFKLYAAADRGGYHVDDLLMLKPTEDELADAVRWACTHDTSEGFLKIVISMLNKLGYENVVRKISG